MQNNEFFKLDANETKEIAETLKNLPESYRRTLYGTIIGLKMAVDLKETSPEITAQAAV